MIVINYQSITLWKINDPISSSHFGRTMQCRGLGYQFTTCLMILKLGHYNSNSLIWSGAQCKLQKLLKVLGIYVSMKKDHQFFSSFTLIMWCSKQNYKAVGTRWEGRGERLSPWIFINELNLSQPWMGGIYCPTTLLPSSPWIFRPSYGPVAKQMWNCMRHVHCYSAHVTASHSF